MHNCDTGVACEVADVEGQQMPNPVDVHCGDQPRIVHLRSGDRMTQHQSPPFGVDELVIG
jgi:hypothetical protein